MEKVYDIVALGELLIDFTDNGNSLQGNTLFEANPGGAPCNVLAMLTKLGKKTAFIGKVGDDIFGHKLAQVLSDVGISTEQLLMDKNIRTTLAFVKNDDSGDRSFSFYRNPGADMMLNEEEINPDLISKAKIFHFGTLSMTHEDVAKATKKALEIAKENNCIISFDPNLREPLWDSLEHAKDSVKFGLNYCDILKISDNEIQWLTGCDNFDDGINWIKERYDISLIMLSMGPDGSTAYYNNKKVFVPSYKVNTIETTGAGDTFGACCLNYVLEHGLDTLNNENLKEMLTFANAAAALVTTKKGALKVMPNKEEVLKLISEYYI